MPLYEYVCQDCGVRFDALRLMKDAESAITCKNCLGKNTKRVLSVFYANSGGKSVTASGSCGNCSGGSCTSCGHH